MKRNVSELVFILDRSGSMHGFEADTVGGFNSMIEKQRSEEGTAFVTTYLFNTDCRMLHDRAPLGSVEAMKVKDFCVGGCTALYDAVGGAIKHIESIHKYARKTDVPEHTIFVIATDGYENASRHYSHASIKKMIEEKKELGWEFIFLGANIDVDTVAGDMGISPECAMSFDQSHKGIDEAYCVMSEAISVRRRNRKTTDKKED